MPKKEINLLPRDDFDKKALGKFLIWAMSVGRWIVISTELIVILAFLSRFKLDYDIADLYQSIRTKHSFIQSSSSFEKDFRSFQSRLQGASKLVEAQLDAGQIIDQVAGATPFEVALTNLAYEDEGLKITGITLSEGGLQNFINALSVSPVLSDINVNSVVKQITTSEGIRFNLSAKIKKGEQ